MTCQCAWCGVILGGQREADDSQISHGICPDCAEAALGQIPDTYPVLDLLGQGSGNSTAFPETCPSLS